MQTLLDLGNTKEEWLVRMTAGLPGGIGNTGFECGGITAPLIQLGLEHGLSAKHDGLPTVIYAGHDYDPAISEVQQLTLVQGNPRRPDESLCHA